MSVAILLAAAELYKFILPQLPVMKCAQVKVHGSVHISVMFFVDFLKNTSLTL